MRKRSKTVRISHEMEEFIKYIKKKRLLTTDIAATRYIAKKGKGNEKR